MFLERVRGGFLQPWAATPSLRARHRPTPARRDSAPPSSPLEPPSFFFLAAPTAWKLPGQGLNLSCCFDLHLSCSHAGSLTHWATAGTLLQPVSCPPFPTRADLGSLPSVSSQGWALLEPRLGLILRHVPSACYSAWYMQTLEVCLQSGRGDRFWSLDRNWSVFASDDVEDMDYSCLIRYWPGKQMCFVDLDSKKGSPPPKQEWVWTMLGASG